MRSTVSGVSFTRAASPLLLLDEDRVLFASDDLAEMTGFTQSELTSPEFRLSVLFRTGEVPKLPWSEEDGVIEGRVTLLPLRGPPLPTRVVASVVSSNPRRLTVVLLEALAGDEPSESVTVRIGRALARAMRTALARDITTLRRLQEEVERVEDAHPERVAADLYALARANADLSQLADVIRELRRKAVVR